MARGPPEVSGRSGPYTSKTPGPCGCEVELRGSCGFLHLMKQYFSQAFTTDSLKLSSSEVIQSGHMVLLNTSSNILSCSGIESVHLQRAHLGFAGLRSFGKAVFQSAESPEPVPPWSLLAPQFIICYFNKRFYILLILFHLGKFYIARSPSWVIFKEAPLENIHQTSKALKLPHLLPHGSRGLSAPRPSLPSSWYARLAFFPTKTDS